MGVRFSFGKCKSRAGYSARLQQKGSIDLGKVRQKYMVLLDTPIVVVITVEEMEIVVHHHGELLFKKGTDAGRMEKIAKEIYELSVRLK